jgi:regulator of protease activity HflC (stomatin/prohibitin superfamily)
MLEPSKRDQQIAKIIVLSVLVLGGIGGVLFLSFFLTGSIPSLIFSIFLLGGSLLFFLSGFRIIEQQERAVIEFLGRFYRVLRPGLRWIIPGIERIKAYVPIWQQPVPLFEERPSIDFKLGGTAVLINPYVWIWPKGRKENDDREIDKSVAKMIYNVEEANYRKATREHIETTFRPTLNNLTVEEALEIIYREQKDWWEVIRENFPWIEENLANFGLEVVRITVTDYQWSEEVVEIRRRVFQSQRSIEVAQYQAKAARHQAEEEARRSGQIHGEIVKILTQKRYGFSREEASRVATQLVTYFRGTETKRLTDIRIGGLEDLIPLLADLLKSLKK